MSSPEMIIDCHTHIFPEELVDRAVAALQEAYQATPVATPTPRGLLEHMAAAGVTISVVCSVATKPAHVPRINNWLLSLAEPRLWPFGAIHPYYEDVAGELRRLEKAGVGGLKLQPFFQQFTLEDPAFGRLLELIGDRFVVLMHAGDEIVPQAHIEPTPVRLARLLDRFPRLRLIAAHGGGYRLWDEVERYLVGRDLFFDISYTSDKVPPEQLRRIVLTHGVEKILWGSDFPWQSQRAALEGLRRLRLSPAQERAILAENLLRLMPLAANLHLRGEN